MFFLFHFPNRNKNKHLPKILGSPLFFFQVLIYCKGMNDFLEIESSFPYLSNVFDYEIIGIFVFVRL